MRAFVLAAVTMMALAGSVQMQGLQGGNLLGNLLGGLGLTSPPQQQQFPTGLLNQLLQSLSPNQMTPMQQMMSQLQPMNQMQGMNQPAPNQLTDQLTQALTQILQPNQMRQMQQQQLPFQSQQMMPSQNGASGLISMISHLPRRSIEMAQNVLDGLARMFPESPDSPSRQQLMPNLMDPRSLQNLPPNQLQGIESMVRQLTQQLSQGRTPDISQLTNELAQTLGSLTGPLPPRGPSAPPAGPHSPPSGPEPPRP